MYAEEAYHAELSGRIAVSGFKINFHTSHNTHKYTHTWARVTILICVMASRNYRTTLKELYQDNSYTSSTLALLLSGHRLSKLRELLTVQLTFASVSVHSFLSFIFDFHGSLTKL